MSGPASWLRLAGEDPRVAEWAFEDSIFNQACFHARMCVSPAPGRSMRARTPALPGIRRAYRSRRRRLPQHRNAPGSWCRARISRASLSRLCPRISWASMAHGSSFWTDSTFRPATPMLCQGHWTVDYPMRRTQLKRSPSRAMCYGSWRRPSGPLMPTGTPRSTSAPTVSMAAPAHSRLVVESVPSSRGDTLSVRMKGFRVEATWCSCQLSASVASGFTITV